MGLVALGTLPQPPLFSSRLDATIRLPQFGGDSASGWATTSARRGAPRRPQWEGLFLPPLVRLTAHPRRLLTTVLSLAGSLSFTLTSKGSALLQKDLGAGLEGGVRDAIVSSPQREAGPLGGCLGSSGPLSELSPTLLIRPGSAGSAPRPGRSRRRAHGQGRARPRASKWPPRENLFLQPPLGVGGRREGTGLREVNWFPPGARFPAAPADHLFFLPPRAATQRVPFRDGGGARAGPGRGCEWAAAGGWDRVGGPPLGLFATAGRQKRLGVGIVAPRPEPSRTASSAGAPGTQSRRGCQSASTCLRLLALQPCETLVGLFSNHTLVLSFFKSRPTTAQLHHENCPTP